MLSAGPLNLPEIFDRVDSAIDQNANITDRIIEAATLDLGHDVDTNNENVTAMNLDKARSTMRQLFRDWSAHGAPERKQCYQPIMQDLEHQFARVKDKSTISVLVPGAGLHRLVFEISRRGYDVEGNEMSWHQILASNWVLNYIKKGQTYTLYPFATDFSNVKSRRYQFEAVEVPDINPSSALEKASRESTVPCGQRLRQTTGDFVKLYRKEEYKGQFNAVATVFFLDTAPNVIRYIETVHHCLKVGGIWMNLGPLLWQFANRVPTDEDETTTSRVHDTTGIEEPGSFELTDEEVLVLVKKMGFTVTMHDRDTKIAGYMQDRRSLLHSSYRPSHWVARKRV